MDTTLWIVLGIVAFLAFFAALSLVLKRFGGYAPGWRIRCAACGYFHPAAEAGIIRVAAVGTKHTIARCSACGKVGHAIIERYPSSVDLPTGKAVTGEPGS